MPSPARLARLALLLVVGLGVVLRFAALDFGRDLLHARPDELGVVETLRSMRVGRLFPMHLAYGGGYHAPLYAFARVVSTIGGHDADLVVGTTPGYLRLELIARYWSALLSSATVGLAYLLGRRLGGGATGLAAAALLAASTLAVREAHFAKADSAAAFAATLVLLAIVHPWARRGARLAVPGAAAGLALGTKYVVGVLPAVLVARVTAPESARRRLAAVAVTALVGAAVFLAMNPFWLTAPRLAWTYAGLVARSQATFTSLPWFVGTVPGPLRYHTTVSLRFGCGLAFALLALPAVILALRRPGPARLVAIAVLGHAAVLMTNPLVVARNLLPAVPALAVLIALLLTTTLERRGPALALLAVLAVTLEPLGAATRLVRLLGRTDTRTLAGAWLAEHLPSGARIATWGAPGEAQPFGLPPLGDRPIFDRLPAERWRTEGITHVVWHHYPLPYSSEPLPAGAGPLASLAVFEPFDGATHDDPVLEPLDAFYLPLARFAGIARPGPRLEIFALGSPP